MRFCVAHFFARKTHKMANGETIESYVPARLDALPWSSWHWLIVVSLGATWILDGLEVTLAGALGGVLTRPETLGLTPARVGASATSYLAGAVIRCTAFRLRDRPIWPQEIVLHYGRGLSHRHSAIGFLMEFLELRILSRGDRRRNWRRIRSDQFRNRRTDSRARARPCRFDHQRLILGRRRTRGSRYAFPARSAADSDLAWMAIRIRNRGDAGPYCDFLSPLDSRESALVNDSWPQSGSRTDCRRGGTKDRRCEKFGSHQTAATVTCSPRAFEHAHIRLGTRFGTRLCTSIAGVRFSVLC